jgi:hypothetical protein
MVWYSRAAVEAAAGPGLGLRTAASFGARVKDRGVFKEGR